MESDGEKIYASDISGRLYRFIISKKILKEKLKPNMTSEEIAFANIVINRELGQNVEEGQAWKRKRGREQDGLTVTVYDKKGRDYLLYLTMWDSSEAIVLKGANYKEFHRRSNFATDDLIEMWAFKDEDGGKLCFVIGKKFDIKLSL
ncbi:hypothetical protein KFK09_013115 [Dendrobium nobile]|uniref:Uncharacterized protein n=1 Tax=Dendrobium nobile TaxID=94219 RepID=A0A8T3B6I9_DENNO|nr:hypothetical protein KFK09_013115 [Dendrobium nobile]